VSGFQKAIRGEQTVLQDHICKTMNELNMRRCSLVPKNTPGADWRALVLHVRDNPADETFNVRSPFSATPPADPAFCLSCIAPRCLPLAMSCTWAVLVQS
jgi:hypothetical protein